MEALGEGGKAKTEKKEKALGLDGTDELEQTWKLEGSEKRSRDKGGVSAGHNKGRGIGP